MNVERLLARLGLSLDRLRGPQTIAAAAGRSAASFDEARAALAAVAALETAHAGTPAATALRRERLGLEMRFERLRMRAELFRYDALTAGAGFVTSTTRSARAGSLAELHAESAALLAAIVALAERSRAAAPPEA